MTFITGQPEVDLILFSAGAGAFRAGTGIWRNWGKEKMDHKKAVATIALATIVGAVVGMTGWSPSSAMDFMTIIGLTVAVHEGVKGAHHRVKSSRFGKKADEVADEADEMRAAIEDSISIEGLEDE